jgi:hypothetical protein
MLEGHAHPLFRAFPITRTVAVSAGNLPSPYHVYDGHGLLICGHARADTVAAAFAGQDVFPVLTRSGRAVMGLFVCSFTDASLGPHLELQAVALCAPRSDTRVSDDPTAMLAALASRTDRALFSLNLWNDTAPVVAYKTECLGLDAALASGKVALGKRLAFAFHDAQGLALATGEVSVKPLSDLSAIWGLMRQIGLHQTMRLARQPFARSHLVNRKTPVLPRNGRVQTITAADQRVVTRFDGKRDRLVLSGPLAAYGFQALCSEHISPLRLVCLHPDG